MTDFFVVEEQVNELGNLKIVYLNHGFVERRDHQVRLSCPSRLHVPNRNSVHVTRGQSCSCEVSFDENRPAQVRTREVHHVEVRFAEVRSMKVCLAEVCPAELRAVQVCDAEVRSSEIRST
jgi:hypothetical protein